MNNKEYNYVKLFNKDRYDNSLSYIINDTIYMPNYDEEYEFKTLIALNVTNKNVSRINLDYSIDYDAYIVGNIKNKLYIFDNKSAVLYEINTKNGKTKIIANNEMGYVKYEDGEFVNCSKNEYKIDKITFDNKKSNYSYNYNNSTIKIINDNKEIKTKINNNNINIIYEKNNTIYYVYEDGFYKYNPVYGNLKIFYDYELKFNNSKSVFVYLK
jgi:hypothetical protein